MFFSKKKETRVIDLMRGHLELVGKCIELFNNVVCSYCDGVSLDDLKELSYKLHKMEHEADEAEKEIQKQIISGAFLPFYRENFIKIPEMVDKIAGLCVTVSQEIILNPLPIPEKLKESFKRLLKEVCLTYDQFLEIFKYIPNNFDKVIELSEKVSECESKVDAIEWKSKVFLYSLPEEEMRPFEKFHFKNLFVWIGSIADKIENTADYMELTMIKMKV